jgi:ribonuclease HII
MLLPYFNKDIIEAGIDEAGRGCYAGPVFAAAVILPKDFYHPLLNDSKQLKEAERDLLRPIIEKEAIDFAVSQVCNEQIDQINILQATFKAMHQAVDSLKLIPQFLLVDGNRFKMHSIAHQCVIEGDAIYTSIAAASILAKTYRDEFMQQMHKEYPHYGWNTNKGYGTLQHRRAIDEHGICQLHRRSFNIMLSQLELCPAE